MTHMCNWCTLKIQKDKIYPSAKELLNSNIKPVALVSVYTGRIQLWHYFRANKLALRVV